MKYLKNSGVSEEKVINRYKGLSEEEKVAKGKYGRIDTKAWKKMQAKTLSFCIV